MTKGSRPRKKESRAPRGKAPPALLLALLLGLALVLAGAAAAPAADGEYREIAWEDLLPADWQAKNALAGLDLKTLTDDDPAAVKAWESYREESARTPVNPELQGERVSLRGFVVPLEWENSSELKEFLLVPYFGACIHVPPPPANQTVYIRLDRPLKGVRSMDVLRVRGRLRLEERSSGLGASGYRLESDGAELYADGAGPFFAEGLAITFLAGLSTAVGGLLAVARKSFSPRALCLSLSLAAGLMLAFSLTAVQSWFIAPHTPFGGIGAFCAAFLLLTVLTRALPHSACPACEEQPPGSAPRRTGHVHAPGHAGALTAFALSVHNFPEGFAVFSAAATDPGLGLALMGAVAAHNIPLGMAIALPLYHNSGNRGKAFLHALLAGLTQPAGALLGFLAVSPILTSEVRNLIFSCAAGIMAAVAVTELLPAARRDGGTTVAAAGLGAGMILMGAVLLLFPSG